MLTTVQDYEEKISGWRTQVAGLTGALPGWIDTASIILTAFLLWFGFSQFGLFLHGLSAWKGGHPLAALQRSNTQIPPAPEP